MFATKNESIVSLKEEELLLKHATETKQLLTKLALPWDTYIPILHKAFILYLEKVEGRHARNHAIQQTCDFIACMTSLSKSGKTISHLILFYHQQITLLEAMRENRKEL